MKKIIKFIKKNYIIISIILGLIIIIIASVIIVKKLNEKNKINIITKKEKLYQYVINDKIYHDAIVSYQDNRIIDIKSEFDEDNLLYYDAFTKIVIPDNMIVIFYNKNNISYKLPKYSTISKNNDVLIINSNGKEYIKNNFFLYDNLDLYFIPYSSVLKYNDNTINLSEFSYVKVNNNYIMIYNYENDSFIYYDENINSATLTINNFVIDLLNDASVLNGNIGLLNRNIDSLSVLKED
ncbi:MAG: hypothetical protein PUD07_00305 [bacterium]|nr:hypothetical protein [bacterium]